jgi:hypothetical protein
MQGDVGVPGEDAEMMGRFQGPGLSNVTEMRGEERPGTSGGVEKAVRRDREEKVKKDR